MGNIKKYYENTEEIISSKLDIEKLEEELNTYRNSISIALFL